MLLLVSPASSSSLDEYMAVGFEALLALAFEALVVVAAVALLEGVVPIVAVGEDFAAGEKLIFVCRLRSRVFLAIFYRSRSEGHLIQRCETINRCR
jgi:hypothetical protein